MWEIFKYTPKCVRAGLTEPACKGQLLSYQEFCELIIKYCHYSKLNYINLQLNTY